MKKRTKISDQIIILMMFLLLSQINGWCLRATIRQGESKTIKAVDFSKRSQDFIAIARQDNLNIYNQTTFQLLGSISSGNNNIQSIAFSKSNGGLLAIGFNDQDYLNVYTTTSFPFVKKSYNNLGVGRRGMGLDFNTDGSKIIVCGDSSQAREVNNPNSASPTVTNPGVSGSSQARDCQYSPSGLLGVTYSDKVIGIGTGFTVTYNKICNAIDFSPDNTYAIVGCTDSKGYEVRNGVDTGPLFYTDTGSIDAVAYAPDGSVFFMGGVSKTVALFYPNRTLMAKFPVDSAITTGRFDMNSQKLLVGTSGGYAYLFRKDCEFKCEPNYYMDTGSVCKLCNDAIPFCSQCTSPTNCLSCVTGYVLSGGNCIKCSQLGCLQCTADNSICLVCDMGYFLNSTSKKCQRCNSYITYCLLCTSSTNCSKCDSISYYDSTTGKCKLCQTMINRCLTCSDQDKCVSCQIGYYVTSTYTCNKCPSNCVSCNRTTQCLQCANGYYLNASAGPYTGNNNCVKCAAGCVNCNNTGTCIQCEQGKYLDPTTKNCIQCTYPCSICNSTAKCFACMNGYYLTGTGTCTVCDTGCKTCNQTGKCLTCWQSYNLDTNKKCVRCSALYPNCSICTTTGCLMCTQGFFYDTVTSSCLNCLKTIKNCMICKDASNCYECSIGYYETGSTGNASCASCSVGCAKCISGTNCQSCLSTFYYSSGQCLNCVAPCITCLDAGTCLSCGNGYYLDSGTKTCKICYTAIANCLTCYNTSYCVGCQHGYYLNTLKTACIKCPSNCTTCQSNTYCHTCQIGYYLDSTSKTCLQCQTSCATCSSQNVCQKCIQGYYLDTSDNSCKKCSLSNCIQCLSATQCMQCSDGTFLDSLATSPTYKTCINCNNIVTNCILCNDNKQCTLCNYGFGLSSNRLSCSSCSSAIMGCINCQKISNCLSCQPQFYLSDINSDGLNQCTPCTKGCNTCTTSAICQSCFQGFYLDSNGKCLTCQQSIQGCQICDNSTGTVQCLKCKKQYFNSSTTVCSLCSQTIYGCLYCNDSTHCLLCQSGSYLDYYIDASTQKCKLCSNILDGCELCSSDSVCLQCQNGYFLDSSNKCLKCTTTLFSCLSCSNNTHCSLCDQQTYLSPTTHTCVSCAKDLFGCISCTSSLSCIQCDSGFYLNSITSKCQKCQQQGCEICFESDPLKCITCNSLYVMDDTTKTCKLCNSLVPGCIECHNVTGTVKCNQCMIGYYHNLAGQCKLCSSNNKGCVRCVDENHCIQCESLYFLSTNATHSFCTLCSTPIPHCDICNVSTHCIQCASSFFLSTSQDQCRFCSEYIENCIYCEDQSTCILCDTEYFIESGKCEKCSSHLQGCYSCADSTHCTACKNGYVYDANTTACKVLILSAPQPAVKTLKLKSYYESKQQLRHVLFSQGMKFNKSTTQIQTLMRQITIIMKDKQLIQYELVIKSWQLSKDMYSIVFFTNNPIDFNGILQKNSSQYKMQFRLLQDKDLTDLNIDTDLNIPKDLSKQLLPQLDYNSDVQVNYNLNQPQFYNSLMMNSQFFQSKYYIFGYVVLSVLLINFIVKMFFTGKGEILNYGQIIPHLIAIKTVGIAVYPGHFEMISFSKGFMLYDIPWANNFFGSVFGSPFDYQPQGYKLFYTNLNIGSTYFIALLLLITLIIIDRVFMIKKIHNYKQKQQDEQQRSQLEDNAQRLGKWFKSNKSSLQQTKLQILYTNVFGFSLVQLSLCSLIGAIYSEFPDIGINFIMYLLGSCIYFVVLIHSVYVSCMNFAVYSNNLRIFIKATVLSLSYLAPVYLVVVAFLIDSVLLIVEYRHSPYGVNNNGKDKSLRAKKLFYISQFLSNITLLFVFFINSRLISFVVAVLLITICVFIEFFLHYKEYNTPYQTPKKLNQSSQSNLMISQNQQFSQSNGLGHFKTKINFNSTNYSNDLTTIVPKKTTRNSKNPKSLAKSHEIHRRDKNQGFFNNI